MPQYQFKAMDAGGKTVFGSSSAPDQEGLADILRGQGLFLMECAATADASAAGPASATAVVHKKTWFRRSKTPSAEDVSFFTTQMAVMLQTGLPILESIELLSGQARTPEFRDILHEISENVSRGQPLSASFKRHPRAFDDVYISLVSAGEANGRLDAMLGRLAEYLEFKLSMRRKIRSALLYPAIVITTAMAVVVFMLVFVIPTFVTVFKELNATLPLPTVILIAVSDFLRGYWYLFVGAAAAAYAGHKALLKNDPRYSKRLDRLALRTPIIGELVRNIVLTRILRTIASLLDSGVSILRALDLAKDAAGNSVFREQLEKTAAEVRDGKTLSASLAEAPEIPRLVISMIATGERTGALPTVIDRVSGYYESETDTSIQNLFSALEPIFIVILGVMVGGIAITVLLPMFDLARGIQ